MKTAWLFLKLYWWKLFTIFLSIVICWDYVDNIGGFVYDKLTAVGASPKQIFVIIDENTFLNVLLSVGVVVAIVQLLIRRYIDNFFSFFKSGLSLCAIVLFCRQTKWVFVATVIPFLKYNVLLYVGALLYLLMPLIRRVIDKMKTGKEEKPKTKVLTLLSDSEGSSCISDSRKKYAKQLADRLVKTNVKDEAYAVGVAGEWGSGKTLFLSEVEKSIGKEAIIIKYNPWNSRDEKHLTKDFLQTLSSNLSPEYSVISSTIKQYATLLYSLRISVASDYVSQYLPKIEETDLAQKKKKIEEALERIGKPVVVFVDDIDRLEGEEVFEVLKIIRNTASFSHLMYVVAYDKTHVVKQLSRLDIGNGSDYLEKIFQMEVQIPKPDERMLQEELKSACRAMSVYTSSFNSLFDKLKEEDYHVMMKVLPSYRKVKRFARQFSFNANYMMSNLADRTFELSDLLYLNLIEYYDSECYKKLWQNPEEVFEERKHSVTNAIYYVLSPSSKTKPSNEKDSISDYLLGKLFGEEPDYKMHSIQFVDQFYTYFYLAQPERTLSEQSFIEMLDMPISHVAHDGMKAAIRSWVYSKDNKSCASIYRQFVGYDTINQKDYQKCVNYIHAVFYWLELENREYDHLKDLLPHVLDKSKFKSDTKERIVKLVNQKVIYLAEKDHYRATALVLSELYRRLDAGEKLLVDMVSVETALKKNTERFLKSNDWDPICLYRNDDNIMKSVINAYCVKLKSQNNKRVNLAIHQLVDYYSVPEHKSDSYVEANSMLSQMPYQRVNADDDPNNPSLTFGDDLTLAEMMLKTCFNGINR